MLVSRWLRTPAKFVLGVVMITPVVAIPLAILVDRGPAGDTRISPHFFPLVLWLFDDFAWTCARNSVVFAIVVSLLSLVVGAVLGWIVARSRFWGQGILYGLVLALLAVAPAFLALGLGGIFGSPRPWPWPFSVDEGGVPGASLETWRGLPLWIEWIWTTLPWGVALVAFVTSSAVEQLEPSWADAARLTGVGSFRAWKVLVWPLVRPRSARAAALVFVFALAEPGAPLVLGLRRTLAFQVVDAVSRPDPFPATAVWGVMTGLFGLAGWIAWRWAAGPLILEYHAGAAARARRRRSSVRTSRIRPLLMTLVLAGWAVFGWLPVFGLVRVMIGGSRIAPLSTGGSLRAIEEHARQMSQPPVTQLVANSLLLGLEIAIATIAIAWLAGPTAAVRRKQPIGTRLVRLIGCAPPFLQGVGLLAISWLAALGSATLAGAGGWRQLAVGLESLAAWLDPARNSWIAMSCCVALAIVPRFLWFLPRASQTDRSSTATASARDAALLAGASHARAARLSLPWARGRWLAGGLLIGSLAATNLTPALLFEPWSDGRTLAPAIVQLAAGPAQARSLAAALALGAIAINIAALCIAWATSALPHSVDLE